MAELDLETIERAVRWCAEAGRQTTAGEVRAALVTLDWDQLLSVRSLLSEPPPARPLGPHALADMARGVPADVAAEREGKARYPRPGATSPPIPGQPPVAPAPDVPPRRTGKNARRQVVVRKAVAVSIEPPPSPPRLPLLEELLLPAGRGELSRLIRRLGGRRPLLVAAVAATHRRADGTPLGDADLDAALEHHGLDRAFLRRERDELFHAVRAAAGVLAMAAATLGHDLTSLDAAISRLGLDVEVKRLREARRRDLRSRATLSERALLWVGSGDALADLDLLEEFETDLRRRLPEHLRALATTGEPLELGLSRTLALPGAAVKQLLTRLGIDLRAPIAPPAPAARQATPTIRRTPPRAAPSRGRERPSVGRPSGGRPFNPRPPGPRPPGPRPSGGRPSGGRTSGSRPPGGRPPGSRPSGSRPPGGRPPASRPSGSRPSGGRPPGSRPSGSRPSGGRPPGSRPSGGRPSGQRRPIPGGGRRDPTR